MKNIFFVVFFVFFRFFWENFHLTGSRKVNKQMTSKFDMFCVLMIPTLGPSDVTVNGQIFFWEQKTEFFLDFWHAVGN